ncbi:hypothetical protein BPAE_0010g00300 [Botrytis paeoniae]|uniref:Uncharacterized protein n=1 Tax=Botrytis paeoniae TaxID=278948 RepID=A0A4Z1FYQ3_9HELO|nr:hypothetical protein BPAE_0010g00300 [Botrytis paeoniae]
MPTPEEISKEKRDRANASQRERYAKRPEAIKARKEERKRATRELRINDPEAAEAKREKYNASQRARRQDLPKRAMDALYNAEYRNPPGNPELGTLRKEWIAKSRSESHRRKWGKEQAAVSESNDSPGLPTSEDYSADTRWFDDEEFSKLTLSPPHLSASPGVYESTELAASFPTNEGKSCLPATDSDLAPSRHENQYPAPNRYITAESGSRDNYASPTTDLYSASPKNKYQSRKTSRHSSAGSKSRHGHIPPATDSHPAPPVQSYNSALNTASYASGNPI